MCCLPSKLATTPIATTLIHSALRGCDICVRAGCGHHPGHAPLLGREPVLAVPALSRGCELPLPADRRTAAQVQALESGSLGPLGMWVNGFSRCARCWVELGPERRSWTHLPAQLGATVVGKHQPPEQSADAPPLPFHSHSSHVTPPQPHPLAALVPMAPSSPAALPAAAWHLRLQRSSLKLSWRQV